MTIRYNGKDIPITRHLVAMVIESHESEPSKTIMALLLAGF